MNDKELRKLSRSELLEMLLEQSKEVESLQQQLKDAQTQLESRTLLINQSGSIAEAALKVSHVFEAAQMAADQYLDNVHQMTQRQNEICAQMEAESKAKADKMLADATFKCNTMSTETEARCRTMESETQAKCQQMLERAETDSKAYWIEVSAKLEMFLQQHAGLRELLSFSMPK